MPKCFNSTGHWTVFFSKSCLPNILFLYNNNSNGYNNSSNNNINGYNNSRNSYYKSNGNNYYNDSIALKPNRTVC